MNINLNSINMWLHDRDLEISTLKNKGMIFSKKQEISRLETLQIMNTPLEWVKEYKYLGVIIDNKLKWESYCKEIIKKTQKGNNIIRRLCTTLYGEDPKTWIFTKL